MARFGFLIFGLFYATGAAMAAEPTHSFTCTYSGRSGEQTIEFSIPAVKNAAPGKIFGLGQLAIRGSDAPLLFVAQSNGIELQGSRLISASLAVVGRGTVRIARSQDGDNALMLSSVEEVGVFNRPVQVNCTTAAQRLR